MSIPKKTVDKMRKDTFEKYDELINIEKLDKDLSKKEFKYLMSNLERFNTLANMRQHFIPKKIGYTVTIFRVQRNNDNVAYAHMYTDVDADVDADVDTSTSTSYVSFGPSYQSCDGEYRLHFVKLENIMKIRQEYPKTYNPIEENILRQMSNGDIEFHVNFLYPSLDNAALKDNHSNWINEMRLPIILFEAMWLLNIQDVYYSTTPNHIYYKYLRVVFSDQDRKIYEAIEAFMGKMDFVRMIGKLNKLQPNTRTKCGQKIIPLSIADAEHYMNVKYSTWRELYINGLVGDLILNNITPGIPFMGDFFFIEGIEHILFDNDIMHTKLDNSKDALEIVEELETVREKTFSELYRERKLGNPNLKNPKNPKNLKNLKNPKKPKNQKSKKTPKTIEEFENDLIESIKYKNQHFENLSGHIEKAMDYAEDEIVLSGLGLCVVSEYIGRTLRDIVAMVKVDIPPVIGPILTDYTTFSKYMFEYIYTLYCLNSKVGVMHGDLHLNNVVIHRFLDSKYKENNTMTVYEVDDKTYIMPYYGSHSGIIDFSRGILDEWRVQKDFDEDFAIEYTDIQRKQILRLYKHQFPEFYKTHQIKLREFVKENYKLAFKIATAFDAYRLSDEITKLLKIIGADAKIPKSFYDLISKIKGISSHFIEEVMQSALLSGRTNIVFPNLKILRDCFDNLVFVDGSTNKNEVKSGKTDKKDEQDITLCDYFRYQNEMKYSAKGEDTYPEIMTMAFIDGLRKKYKIPLKAQHDIVRKYILGREGDEMEIAKALNRVEKVKRK